MTQAFLRPIEITSSNDSFTINHNGGGAQVKALTNGVYACILSLLREFEITCQTTDADFDAYLDSTWHVVLTTAGGHTNEIVFSDEALAELLGFGDADLSGGGNDTLSAAVTHTATYTPAHCWLPTYQSADREYWGRRQGDAFRGTMSQSGRLAGITAGPTLYYRQFTYENETALLTYRSADTGERETLDATSFYFNQRRTFEEFMEQCRQSSPTVTSNPTTKGFYYLPDRAVYTGSSPTVAIPTNLTSGGVDFYQSSNQDYYVYCHAEVDGAPDPSPSMPNNRDYYRIQFEAHTATAPTFTTAA